jgi:hypothetical protein
MTKSLSFPDRFTPGEKSTYYLMDRIWVSPSADLDTGEEKNVLPQELNPDSLVILPVAHCYTK